MALSKEKYALVCNNEYINLRFLQNDNYFDFSGLYFRKGNKKNDFKTWNLVYLQAHKCNYFLIQKLCKENFPKVLMFRS